MSKNKKLLKYGLLSCGILLLTAGFTACERQEPVQEVVLPQIEVSSGNPMVEEQFSKVVYGDVVKRDLYTGTITPYVEELFFEENGIFLEYCVTLGEEVTEGQVLAKTDTEALEAAVEQLQESIASLTDTYEYKVASIQNSLAILEEEMAINYEALEAMEYMAPGYTETCQALGRQDKSKKTYELELKQLAEVYELQLPYYQKKLKETKKLLNSNVIKAPFDGVVVELRSMAGGDSVSADQPYVAVADNSRYLAMGTYVGSSVIDKAQRVYVFINGKEYEAEYIPMESKTYNAIIAKGEVPYSSYEIRNPEGLSFGQSAVVVVQKESKENVLTIPYICVKPEAASYFCYVKRGDKREKVYIELGLFDGMNYEVLSGLTEGEEVVIE